MPTAAGSQVYRKIANPYMPNGTPDKTNSPSPFYAPGELGCAFTDMNTGKVWLRAQLDSGATAATPVGAVQVGQLAFWKDKLRAIVTNDSRFCDLTAAGAVNHVAGIFQAAVTAAPGVLGTDGLPVMYLCDLVIRGMNVQVQATGSLALGMQVVANTAASTANSIGVAVGTAPGTQPLGVWSSATIVGGLALADVFVGFSE